MPPGFANCFIWFLNFLRFLSAAGVHTALAGTLPLNISKWNTLSNKNYMLCWYFNFWTTAGSLWSSYRVLWDRHLVNVCIPSVSLPVISVSFSAFSYSAAKPEWQSNGGVNKHYHTFKEQKQCKKSLLLRDVPAVTFER